MTRLVRWWRLVCWAVASRAALVVEVARLEREVATVRADHEKELLAIEALHNEGMAVQRRANDELRTECERWAALWADADRRVLAERVRGNEAWQEAGRQRRRADQLEVELADWLAVADA